MINPFAPGGGVDVLARMLVEKLSVSLGQPVVIENRPGASTMIGADAVAKAAPDGHTLFITVNNYLIAPLLQRNPPYDPVRDFAPVVMLAKVPNLIIAGSAFPAKTIEEMIALARRTPGGLSYASVGSGSTQHISGELFRRAAGIPLVEIPYKGVAPAMVDVLGGRVALMFTGSVASLAQIRADKIRVLAVMDGERSALFPGVPTLAEAGFRNTDAPTWFALLAPAGTPPAIVERLNREVNAVLKLDEVRDRLVGAGFEIAGGSAQELKVQVEKEHARYRVLVNELNIKAE